MQITKSVLVPHPAEAMFDLIEAVEHYPAFVNGCRAVALLERTDDVVAARLTLRQAGVSIELETRNPKRRPVWMEVKLTRGPFRHFLGEWRLTPLNASACRIDFTLAYEMDGVAGRIAAPVFARIADNLVDAFVARAARVLPAGVAAPKAPPSAALPAQPPAAPEPVSAIEPVAPLFSAEASSGIPSEPPAVASATAPATDPDPGTPLMETLKNDATLLELLRASKLATELTEEESRLLAGVMTLHDLKEGEVLVHEGTSDNHLYLLAKGALGVVKGVETPAERVTINTLSSGDFAGELSFMDGQTRFASLVALSDARVMGLEREKLESLLEAHPWLVYRVMRAIIRAVHQIQYRLSMQQSELSNYIYKQHGRY
jgi:CRP/FNR family transcriptional regulator, cyclic AMP receptor protein